MSGLTHLRSLEPYRQTPFLATCTQAASSRGMAVEAMQEVAQGRVWSGRDALSVGLVDAIGGVNTAVAIAKQAAGLSAHLDVPLTLLGMLLCARSCWSWMGAM